MFIIILVNYSVYLWNSIYLLETMAMQMAMLEIDTITKKEYKYL